MANSYKVYKVCDASRMKRTAFPALRTLGSVLEQGKDIILLTT